MVLAVRRGRNGFEIPVLDCTVAGLRLSFGRFSGAKWMGKGIEQVREEEEDRMLCRVEAWEACFYRPIVGRRGTGMEMVAVAFRWLEGASDGSRRFRRGRATSWRSWNSKRWSEVIGRRQCPAEQWRTSMSMMTATGQERGRGGVQGGR